MTNEMQKNAQVDAFLAKEIEQYKERLLWLEEAMPKSFFSEVGQENVFLVAHSLVGFDLQQFYAEITLHQAAIVVSLNVPDADINTFSRFEKQSIAAMRVFVSEKAFADTKQKLRIALLYFSEGHEIVFAESSQTVIGNLIAKSEENDLVHCEIIRPENYTPRMNHSLMLFVACKSAPKQHFAERLFRVLLANKLRMGNVSLTFLAPESPTRTFVLACELHGIDDAPCWESTNIEMLVRELVLSRYFGQDDIFESTYSSYQQRMALHLLRAAAYFVHELLVQKDPNMYTLANVQEALCYWPEIGLNLFELFSLRFDPYKIDKAAYKNLKGTLLELIERQDTGKELSDFRRKTVLRKALGFVDWTLKTNFFVSNKGALSFRLDPRALQDTHAAFADIPYGIFFIYNREFFGFHVRFRDLARGGLRTIFMRDLESALEEMSLIFLECYQLALTQQKKNKDIPEGGSKGIIFIFPELISDQDRPEALYRCQRLFIESLLSLVNCDSNERLKDSSIVDYLGKPEYLYLGPDENMHDAMIEWIADYAEKVGYKPASAFISSKPHVGINHKRYGVTSLGVNRCMAEALSFVGIDPTTTTFTVKMAGGPDGDVAGNQIRNLLHYYQASCRLLTLIDISGVIYDPKGLDLAYLEKLFFENKPIRFYPPEMLSDEGFLLDMQSERREGVHIVKRQCFKKQDGKVVDEWLTASDAFQIARTFVHKTCADVFIPAGGRPATLSEANVDDFFTSAAAPTAKVIVEGANLYLTEKAREIIEEKGAIVIKDSSANKGGVICSSFEVLATLALAEEQFLEHKDKLIEEILYKIEEYAKAEVLLVLKTFSQTGMRCSKVSGKISERIDSYCDQIRNYLEPFVLSQELTDPLMICFFDHCLPLLSQKFSKQLLEKIPEMHKKAIIASWIASKVVYLRGLDWAPSIVDVLPLIIQDPRITACPLKFQ
jgi:glutamate dehydrogenase